MDCHLSKNSLRNAVIYFIHIYLKETLDTNDHAFFFPSFYMCKGILI